MKALEILCEPISNGGQEAFVMNVYNNINMDNLQIDLFTPYYCDNMYYARQVRARGGKVYSKNLEFNPGGFKFNIIAPIRALIRKNKYDIVHIHSGSVFSLMCASLAASMENVKKIIVHSHSSADSHTLKRDLIKFCCTPVINRCATDFLACSEEAGKWKFSKRICEEKLQVVKNGIDLKKFEYNEKIRNRIRKELNVSDKTLLLGHVGRFAYEKNHVFLIDLLNDLVDIGIDVKLLLIGSGELLDEIKQEVNNKNLTDKVIFTGNVNNVNDYMQAMDIFMLPSLYEGLGIVAIEAQAAGLKVIVSNNVPEDVLITPNVLMKNIENREKWIKPILKLNNYERQNDCIYKKMADFDVSNTCNVIRNIYLND